MNKEKIIELFDNEKYKEVYEFCCPYNKMDVKDYEILYFLKSKIVLDDYKVRDVLEIKKLFFYYFYLLWKVEFENSYVFYFNKNLKIGFNSFEKDISYLKNFKNYFTFWKNEVFLNKIIDKSIKQNKMNFKHWAVGVDNIVDFFINFTYECSQLYAFSWEHFPLFKWLINQLANE